MRPVAAFTPLLDVPKRGKKMVFHLSLEFALGPMSAHNVPLMWSAAAQKCTLHSAVVASCASNHHITRNLKQVKIFELD